MDTNRIRQRGIRKKNRFLTLSIFCAMILGLVFCKTSQNSLPSQEPVVGVQNGALPTSVQSVVVGDPASNTSVAVVLGASVGGDPGLYISKQMDTQAQAMGKPEDKNMRIMRLGEGIKITFDGTVLFPENSDSLSVESHESLKHVAEILNVYAESNVIIEGHTDNMGGKSHNLKLSMKRATSVADFLKENRVSGDRIKVVGYGESQPLFANTTADGRRQNRRVELLITANDQLKAKARGQSSNR